MNNKAAFSIVEIFVVIVIMGVLAAMAIPNYIVGLNRTNARNALDNLLAIQGAQIIYGEAHNQYYQSADPVPSSETQNINQALHLNITPDSQTNYYCTSASICRAVRQGSGGFTITLDLKLPMNRIGNNLIYCDGQEATASYNPCCSQSNGSSSNPGDICP